jgi:hypothetical protein
MLVSHHGFTGTSERKRSLPLGVIIRNEKETVKMGRAGRQKYDK